MARKRVQNRFGNCIWRFESSHPSQTVRSLRGKFLMAHAVDQDITDSYTNVSALRKRLREAAETVAAFIVRHAGCNPSKPGLRGDDQIVMS
jgi:hypothetical protein